MTSTLRRTARSTWGTSITATRGAAAHGEGQAKEATPTAPTPWGSPVERSCPARSLSASHLSSASRRSKQRRRQVDCTSSPGTAVPAVGARLAGSPPTSQHGNSPMPPTCSRRTLEVDRSSVARRWRTIGASREPTPLTWNRPRTPPSGWLCRSPPDTSSTTPRHTRRCSATSSRPKGRRQPPRSPRRRPHDQPSPHRHRRRSRPHRRAHRQSAQEQRGR